MEGIVRGSVGLLLLVTGEAEVSQTPSVPCFLRVGETAVDMCYSLP